MVNSLSFLYNYFLSNKMSLNQIIDQNPGSALVCDTTLKLKAEQMRVETFLSASTLIVDSLIINPTSTNVVSYSCPITLWDGSVARACLDASAAPSTTLVQFEKIAGITAVRIQAFTVASSATTGTGKFRINFPAALPVRFEPLGGQVAFPSKSISNGAALTTPGEVEFDASGYLYFECFSNFANANYVTGITGSTTINAGLVNDCNFAYRSV